MGDEENGLAGLVLDAQQLALQDLAGLGVQRAEGLVHQQDGRVDGERAGEAHALLHAARELVGKLLPSSAKANQLQQFLRPLVTLRGGQALKLQPELHICARRAPRQKRRLLEDEAAIAARRGDGLAVDTDHAPVEAHQALHDAQERRLSAAALADQRDDLALRHIKADVAKHWQKVILGIATAAHAEGLRHIFDAQLDAACHGFPTFSRFTLPLND